MNVFMLAVASIALSVSAQFSLKAGMTQLRAAEPVAALGGLLPFLTNKFLLLGFALYGLGALVWLGVLARWEVSKAYPIVGLGFLFSAVVGFALGEQVTLFRAAGMGLIAAGVVVIALS